MGWEVRLHQALLSALTGQLIESLTHVCRLQVDACTEGEGE